MQRHRNFPDVPGRVCARLTCVIALFAVSTIHLSDEQMIGTGRTWNELREDEFSTPLQ